MEWWNDGILVYKGCDPFVNFFSRCILPLIHHFFIPEPIIPLFQHSNVPIGAKPLSSSGIGAIILSTHYNNNFKYSQPNSANATALDHLELMIRLATGIHQAVRHFF